MTRLFITICILLCFIPVNAQTEGETSVKLDLSDIEAQERQQIISELTYRLESKQTCTQTLIWDDSGSGADLDGYFFIPTVGKTEYMIGGHASGKRRSKYHCVITVSEARTNPKGIPPLLVAPADWKQVWKDSGSGATKDGSFWQAIPPDKNYRCVGSVSQLGHNQKPTLANYRCVHSSLTEKVVTSLIVWSDKSSGADQPVTVFGLPNTGTFIAVPKRVSQTEAVVLRKNVTSIPDPKMVDEILAKRMAPVKADIAAKTKAIQEQKFAVEAAEKKKHAQAAEQKRKAKEVEKKKHAQKEEQKRLEKIEQARLAEVEKQQKLTEQETSVVKVEQKKIIEEIAQQELTEEKEQKPILVEERNQIKQTVANNEAISTGKSKKSSKGLNNLLMDIVKVFLLLLGGVIILVVVFKFVFGSKKEKG